MLCCSYYSYRVQYHWFYTCFLHNQRLFFETLFIHNVKNNKKRKEKCSCNDSVDVVVCVCAYVMYNYNLISSSK